MSEKNIKIQTGKKYITRRGDIVKDLSYNKHGDEEPENYTGTMSQKDGTIVYANWHEDGSYMADGLMRDTDDHPSDIVGEASSSTNKEK